MFGIIGTGAMGSAIARGIVQAKACKQSEVGLYDIDSNKASALSEELGVRAFTDCEELISRSNMLLLAIKPNMVFSALRSWKEDLAGKAVISIAAGWTSDMLTEVLDPATRILRCMPNTPALIGQGMTAFSKSSTFSEAERATAEKLFSSIGRLAWVEERQMEAVIGVSGSGPAYVFLFLEALADGGVAAGLSRAQALEFAAQTIMGSAALAIQTGQHPGALKDMVCSPGGTTIEAVRILEENGFRGSVIDAVLAAAKKAGEMR